jgi:hypothetical protein
MRCIINDQGSLGVEPSQEVPAEAGVGGALVVVVVDVVELAHPRELHLLQVLADQQVHPLQLEHPAQQPVRPVDGVRVLLQRPDHAPRLLRRLLVVLEDLRELLGVGLAEEGALEAEVGVRGDGVVPRPPADASRAHCVVDALH